MLAAYEVVQTALGMVGTEAQLLLAPPLPVLGWTFPSTRYAADATWSRWITQRSWIENPSHPSILELIIEWLKGKEFGVSSGKGGDVLKRLHCTVNCQKMRRNRLCSVMGSVALWKSFGSERLLYSVLHDQLQKLLKEKMNWTNLQKWMPSSWL